VRHLRMVGVCLVAVFALGATTFVVASPALAAGCNQECKELKEKEKQEAKEAKAKAKQEAAEAKANAKKEKERLKREQEAETGKGEYAKFADCSITPSHVPNGCIYGEAGPESFFQAGKITVNFVKPVILRGGFTENEETEVLTWEGGLDGNTISKEAEPAPPLNEDINAELLPAPEKARYEAYIAAGRSTTVTATIELARPETGGIYLSEYNLLGEEGEAFGFPVMIHLSNGFVGTSCYVGSTVEPINVPFTTGETAPEPPNTPIHGAIGGINVNSEGTILELHGTHLVNNEYAAPGVHGCGLNSNADAAINSAIGLPSPAGSNSTELIGNLFQAGAARVAEHVHFH
jgi:hypothetical protein